jgi:hypothetical protein
MITVLILLSFYPYISKINNLWLAHALETKIPELAEKEIPKECIIITEWPIIFSSTTDIQVIRIQKFLDENIFDPEKCFLFFEDFLCDGTYASDPNCKRILNEYETIPFISYNVSKERNHEFSMKKYSFHKLKRKY